MLDTTTIRPQGEQWFRDAKQAFEDAIGNRIFSRHQDDPNFAGDYMYMYSVGIQDAFKHIQTREYIYTDYIA